jgi:hypothetical protein
MVTIYSPRRIKWGKIILIRSGGDGYGTLFPVPDTRGALYKSQQIFGPMELRPNEHIYKVNDVL